MNRFIIPLLCLIAAGAGLPACSNGQTQADGDTGCDNDTDCGLGFYCYFGRCIEESGDGDTTVDGDTIQPDGDTAADGDTSQPDGDCVGPKLQAPSEVNFGAVQLFDRKVEQKELWNVGCSELCVSNLELLEFDEVKEFRIERAPAGNRFCIPPGQNFLLLLSYEPRDVGTDSGRVQMGTNDPERMIFSISLSSEEKGKPSIRITPADHVLDFGSVRILESRRKPVIIENAADDPSANAALVVSTLDVTQGGQFFRVNITGMELPLVLGKGQQRSVEITYYPFSIMENVGVLAVGHNDPDQADVQLSLLGRGMRADIEVAPNPVDFGDVNIGESVTRDIVITNKGEAELYIIDAEIESDSLEFTVDLAGAIPAVLRQNESVVVYATYMPENGGADGARLLIGSNDIEFGAYTVEMLGVGKGAELFVSPSSPYDFGAIYWKDESRPVETTVLNIGFGELILDEVSLVEGGDHFRLGEFRPFQPAAGSPLSLIKGDNDLKFNFYYHPREKNVEHSGLIKIVHRDRFGNRGAYLMELYGQGGDCPPDYYDLDPVIPGCEYYCELQGGQDDPDPELIDNNCDGFDGTVDRGIFVARTGSDSNPGTRELPKKSISGGILAAQLQGKTQVFVSLGTYEENLILVQGVSIYGGYNREAGWLRSFANDTIIAGGIVPVTANNIRQPTVVEGFVIRAADNTLPGSSSYGMYIQGSNENLVIQMCRIEAGEGGDGQDGMDGLNGENGDSGEKGDGTCEYGSCFFWCFACGSCGRPAGGTGGASTCAMNGGRGGSGGSSGGGGSPGSSGVGGASGGSGGGASSRGNVGGNGGNGQNGSDGSGGDGAGTVENGFWLPTAGGGGKAGAHGGGAGGGGGGGGDNCSAFACCKTYGAGGGGGGAGGCGGFGGFGGTGGGGSFGIFLFNASPTIRLNTIATSDGGSGGDAGDGGSGGRGGLGGRGGPPSDQEGGLGGDGGRGGNGGRGGHGGGGGGGPSWCVYRAGYSVPVMTDNRYEPGRGGSGGGSSGPFSAGQRGQSGEVY